MVLPLVKLWSLCLNCLCIFILSCPLLSGVRPMYIGNAEQCALMFIFLSHYTILVILNMSPAQWCKSNKHVGNAEQCAIVFILLHIVHCVFIYVPLLNCVRPMHALAMQSSTHAFTHLLSSNCTSYFVPFHHFICAYCKCISLVVQLAAW